MKISIKNLNKLLKKLEKQENNDKNLPQICLKGALIFV